MIPHNRPTLGIEEEQAAIKVIRSKKLAEGEEVKKFENEFCDFLGLPHDHAVAVSSGTSALFLALSVLDIEKKKILFPSYVCSALRNAVFMAKGIEEIIDVKKDFPNIDIKNIKKSDSNISIVPHMYGVPINLEEIKEKIIIEDCAQALGAKINGINVGLQGTAGIFSFYATKLITTGGQGGIFVSKDKKLVDSVRDFREFDYRKDKKKRFNFQMTDLQAAIGREQLKKLPDFLSRREEIFERYKKAGLELLDVDLNKDEITPVRYRAILKTTNPKKVIDSLASVGVTAIIPIEEWELLENSDSFPNSISFSNNLVSLPIYPSLTNSEIDIIVSGIKT